RSFLTTFTTRTARRWSCFPSWPLHSAICRCCCSVRTVSDELRRDHPLRRVRAELRQARLLNELAIEPLALGETTALIGQLLGNSPASALASVLYERTKGVPFCVEELVAALLPTGRVRADDTL